MTSSKHTQEKASRLPVVFKYAAAACTLALIGVGSWSIWRLHQIQNRQPDALQPEIMSEEETLAMHRTAARLLATHIQKNHESPVILVIAPPAEIKSPVETAMTETLVAKLRDIAAMVEVANPKIDKDASPWANLWFRAAAFDELADEYSNVDIVISTVGLPVRPEQMKFWKKKTRPTLMLLNAQTFRLAKLIEGGDIAAVVTLDPAAAAAMPPPPPESNANWLLITPRNVEVIKKRHKNMFVQ